MLSLRQVKPDGRPLRGRVCLGLAMTALALLFATAPSMASAADYEVEVCTSRSTAGEGIQLTHPGPPPFLFANCGTQVSDGFVQGSTGGQFQEGDFQTWELHAPPSTTIRGLDLEYSFQDQAANRSFLFWLLTTGNGALLAEQLDDRPLPAPATISYSLNTQAIRGTIFCPSYSNHLCPGGSFEVTLRGMVVELEDATPPVVSNPALPAGPARGITPVSYSATDFGSGLAGAALIVDGVEQLDVHDSNGGKCDLLSRSEPGPPVYQYLVPCRLSVNSSIPLDTRSLPDGQHQVEVLAFDATGEETTSGSTTLTVHNAPTSTRRPAIEGTARIGAQLTAAPGTWEGSPEGFAYQWLWCPASVRAADESTSCVPISGATSRQYVPGAADLNQRAMVRVTAVNSSGTGSEASPPSDVIAATTGPRGQPPVLSHGKLSRRRFRTVKGTKTKGRGTVLSFSSDKPGQLSILLERRRHGKSPKPYAKLAAVIKAGRSSVLLTGTIGKRRMPPGTYQVTITVRDAKGNVSAPISLPFTVLPG